MFVADGRGRHRPMAVFAIEKLKKPYRTFHRSGMRAGRRRILQILNQLRAFQLPG